MQPSFAQTLPDLSRIPSGPAPAPEPPAAAPAALVRRADLPPPGWVDVFAVTQLTEGPWRRLRGNARITTDEMELQADEVDYDQERDYAEARGHVRFTHFQRGESLEADRVEYFLKEERGNFYNIRGELRSKIETRPGVLATSNPFYFQGKWAERLGERYILHEGFITNCRLPRPWWTLRAPRFDIAPGQRAIAQRAMFRVRKVPIFYAPAFYKSLERAPRRSGLLTPNVGNSSRRGLMLGASYYWAINRSYDLTYRAQLFTARGVAHNVDIRGKPRAGTDFNTIIYGVNDRGLDLGGGERRKEGGLMVSSRFQTQLAHGFEGRADINFLSSLLFRQAFTESFQEAVFSETASTAYLSRHWQTYSLNFAFTRIENFQTILPDDKILIRRLPEISFLSRDRQVSRRILPVWVSLDSSAALLHRSQPPLERFREDEEGLTVDTQRLRTAQFLSRMDAAPRVSTALRWKDFHLVPSFSLRETYYGQTQSGGVVRGASLLRSAREFTVDLVPPSLARTFHRKSLLGDQVKHIIEPRLSFRHAAGVADFNRIIRFDETELLSNTTEAEAALINRIWIKRKGVAYEALTWQVWQRRYFDPEFGGAIVDGTRNVLLSSTQLTAYTFLDRVRRYSPVVSALRAVPRAGVGIEWRSDYDPLLRQWVNSSITGDARIGAYFASVGHSYVRSTEVLTPKANQLRTALGIGMPSRKGWNAAFSSIYDFRQGVMQFATTEVAYNTDCCGLSIQYRRFGFGSRNENQFRVAFAVANLGSFGTLRKQEKMF
jgi:LPS-assembly protein